MKGFFYPLKKKKEKKNNLSKKKDRFSCESCGLYKNCISPKMQLTGKGKKKILIIAEAPGKKEDEQGIQLIGESGRYLRKILKEHNIDLDRDCWKTNAVICHPKENKTPTNLQIASCRKNLFKIIEKYNPEKIIILGKIALQSLIGERIHIEGIEKWIGWKIPDPVLKCWIYPVYHPAYILRNKGTVFEKLFYNNIKEIIEHEEICTDYSNDEKKIEIIDNPFIAIIFLQGILPGSEIAFDIETTGLKPYSEQQKIISISFCMDENKAVSFPFFKNKEFLLELKKFMRNKEIKKIAHNMKFENTWINEKLNCLIKNWYWDTQLMCHILDNRSRITGLKFQTYINFGNMGYDDKISKYLKAENGNALNKIEELDIKDVLLYNGLDSLYTYRLFKKQKNIIRNNYLFHEGALVFSIMERNGIYIDKEYFKKQQLDIIEKIKKIKKELTYSEEIKLWEKSKPKKYKDKQFNLNSSDQLRILLFDILKYKCQKETKKGNNSADYESLEKLNIPFTKKIIEMRKLEKIKNTYLEGFISEEYEDKIHSMYNLNTVRSYRSSSNNPNFQNIPSRNKEAQKMTRKGIIPSKNNILLEADYSQIEVCISACYHKDTEMIKYIKDLTTDMHRDQAVEIFLMEKEKISKYNRYLAKNNFVFPQFYGDYYKNCAHGLWDKMEKETKSHLKINGIKNYISFENHIKDVENRFWKEKFKIYDSWKNKWYSMYEKNGFVESLSGFIYKGFMTKNEVINYPIQGSAFHCLLWSLIELQKILKRNKFKSKITGQIHDSIILDVIPEEKIQIITCLNKIMTQDIKKFWTWIIVPLSVNIECSKINGNWAEMEEVIDFRGVGEK